MSAWALAPERRTVTWLALVATAPVLALAAAQPGLQGICLTSLLFPALIGCSGFRPAGLVISFLICQSLVHLLKRAIFLFGSQPREVYFGIQLLPTVILLMLAAVVVRQLRAKRLPASARLLAAFLALSIAATLVSIARIPWLEAVTAIHQQLLPGMMFFAGLLLGPEKFARVGRVMGILAAISVVYGLFQLMGGPTALDQAWAREAYTYSLHGSKVFAYLEGVSADFRSYSYYADPLTWGFFLVAGLVGAVAARTLARMSRVLMVGIVLLLLAGLFFSLTRTVWAGLGAVLVLFWLLRYRSLRRPWLVFGLVLSAFGAALMVGDLLYKQLFLERRLPAFQSPIAARYLTVGTIEARTAAWDTLQEVAVTSPVWGQGMGVLFYANRDSEASKVLHAPFSHNFLVDLVFGVGVPGAFIFLWFLYQWLREGFVTLRKLEDSRHRRLARWILAFAAGQVVTGYLNGSSFMTHEFFLIMGVLSGFQLQGAAGSASPVTTGVSANDALRLSAAPEAFHNGRPTW